MSKDIRTLSHLQDAIDRELVWRKREISVLKNKLLLNTKSRGIANEEDLALLRPCVTMIYAHWEGFVKNAASHYLQFVSFQRLRHKEMASPFLAMAIRRHVLERSITGTAADRSIATFLRDHGELQSYLPYKSIVDTKSNLWFHVFEEIFESLGLAWRDYELKRKLIDTKLVGKRNAIAHGQYIDVDHEDVSELFESIVEIINRIADQIFDAATSGLYKI